MTNDTVEAAPEAKHSLKRAIGTPLLFAFIVGDTLGAGIYTLVGTMASDVGGVIWLPLLIALVVALLTAGTYAELITKYPHAGGAARRSEEHTSELQSLKRISYAVFCLKKKKNIYIEQLTSLTNSKAST